MTQDSRRFLQPDAISRISRLEIQARQVVEGFLNGLHRSPYFGQSIEFVQHREYVPGDDTRRIDWKAWSKTDKYYIKQYEEETNLRSMLVVDLSESMLFGSGKMTKYEYACSISAALCYLLLRQQDAVGMTVFDDEIRSRVPIRSQQTHFNSIVHTLANHEPKEKTDMFGVLRNVADEFNRKGMVMIVSDLFADRDGLFKGLKMLRHRGHDVMVFHILDDQEVDFSYSGTTKFIGLEEAGDLTCDPKSLRDGYIDAMKAYLEDVRKFCAGHLIDYQVIRTSEHIDAVLGHYMNHRLGLTQSIRQ